MALSISTHASKSTLATIKLYLLYYTILLYKWLTQTSVVKLCNSYVFALIDFSASYSLPTFQLQDSFFITQQRDVSNKFLTQYKMFFLYHSYYSPQ